MIGLRVGAVLAARKKGLKMSFQKNEEEELKDLSDL